MKNLCIGLSWAAFALLLTLAGITILVPKLQTRNTGPDNPRVSTAISDSADRAPEKANVGEVSKPSPGSKVSSAQDVNGWGKLKWSMEADEVKTLYADHTIEPHKDIPNILVIKAVDIDSLPVDVNVCFNNGSKITSIMLIPHLANHPGSNETVGGSPSERQFVFEYFKSLLIAKYGAPMNEERTPRSMGGMNTILRWRFPSTTIELFWAEGRSPNGYLFVDYLAASTENNPM